MKRATLFILIATTCTALQASSVTVQDPFANGDVCGSTSCDVIGSGNSDRLLFDINKATLTVNSNSVQVDLYFDYGTNNTNLNQFTDKGINLNVGDLFFTVNGVDKYAVALQNHDGNTNGGPQGVQIYAGDLYQINNSAGLLTAQQVLNDPTNDGRTYRRSTDVWAFNDGHGSVTDLGAGNLSIAGGGDGYVNPEFHVTYSFTGGQLLSAAQGQNFGFVFESATCGNDVISGTLPSPVPEPVSMALAGLGLTGIGLLRLRRKSASQ